MIVQDAHLAQFYSVAANNLASKVQHTPKEIRSFEESSGTECCMFRDMKIEGNTRRLQLVDGS